MRTSRLVLAGLALLAVAFPAAAGAARAASAAERAAIISAVRAANTAVGGSPARCDRTSVVRVSTVDGRFARWSQNGRLATSLRCPVGDGYIVLQRRGPGRWAERSEEAFDTAPCSIVGARVARDLVPGLPCDRDPSAGSLRAFVLPSGNIGCIGDRATIRCDILRHAYAAPRRPRNCDLDYGDSVSMGARDRPSLNCHGDTAVDRRSRRLAYGAVFRNGPFTCRASLAGLRCANAAGHGWFLSRSRLTLS
jgi:hypothetical protein